MPNRVKTLIPDDRLPFPDPKRPGCYRVPLAERKRRRRGREAIIDAADLPVVRGHLWRWCADDHHRLGGRVRRATGNLTLARAILGIADPKRLVVHRNDDPLDCRRANLVEYKRAAVNRRQGKWKVARGHKPTSRYRGVCWEADKERWRASIKVDGRQINLGRFRHEVDAAEAYDRAAREHFGEYARLSFPK